MDGTLFNELNPANEAGSNDELIISQENEEKRISKENFLKEVTGECSTLDEKIDNVNATLSDSIQDLEESLKTVSDAVAAEAERAQKAEDDINERYDVVENLIPNQASSDNQLADKDFVNSSIATNTANYISDNGNPFTSVTSLPSTSTSTKPITNNDYAFVTGTDSQGNTYYDRYKATVVGTSVTWGKEYRLNNSSFTAEQWAAIQSGITEELVAKIGQLDETLPISKGGTGKTTAVGALANLNAGMTDGNADVTDETSIITSHTSGRNTSGAVNITYFRKATYLWNYIKGKAASVYSALVHTHVKADITDFPTKVSDFQNDSGFITQHQDISGKLNVSGSNGTATGVSALINKLSTGTSNPVDTDYFISQYVGGGTTTTTFHRRPFSTLWNYIKGKADAVYSALVHTHVKADITDFPTLSAVATSGRYTDLSNTPTEISNFSKTLIELYKYTASPVKYEYYWFLLGKLSSGVSESFDIYVVSDINFDYKSHYKLDVSQYGATSRSISLQHITSANVNVNSNLAVALDAAGNIYLQAYSLWSGCMQVRRTKSTGMAIPLTKLGCNTWGNASTDFTPVKIIARTGSFRYVISGGAITDGKPVIYSDLKGNADSATQDGSGNNIVNTYATKTELNNKQDKLVSGTNIKTINGQSLLGSGNIPISGDGTTPPYTYIVYSDESLYYWLTNGKRGASSGGNDFTSVFIKNGTYELEGAGYINSLSGRTSKITGEGNVVIHLTGGFYPIFSYSSKNTFTSISDITFNIEPDFGSEECSVLKNCCNLTNVNVNVSYLDDSVGETKLFSNCENLVNCNIFTEREDSDVYPVTFTGFYQCSNMVNCISVLSNVGSLDDTIISFRECTKLTNCKATHIHMISENSGFDSCNELINCEIKVETSLVNSYGMRNCHSIVNCYALADSTYKTYLYGFSNCSGVQNCRSLGNRGSYVNCYSLYGSTSSTYNCAATANGGFNVTL